MEGRRWGRQLPRPARRSGFCNRLYPAERLSVFGPLLGKPGRGGFQMGGGLAGESAVPLDMKNIR